MNIERLEQYIKRLPLQELEFRHTSGVYALGNFHTKPAWWHEAVGFARRSHTIQGLKQVLVLIEQCYPDFYVWLVCSFPEEGVVR